MSTPKNKFYPGWRMTFAQRNSYFTYLERVHQIQGNKTAAEKEAGRKAVHVRAFGSAISAKDIDHMKMFDEFKAVCLAIIQPENLAAQVRQVNMPKTRLIQRILSGEFEERYIIALLRSTRFKKESLEDLNGMSEKELTELRDTLCGRADYSRIERVVETEPDGVIDEVLEPVLEGNPF